MAKLEVKLQKIFADIGATGASGEYQLTQFGSLRAGSPLATSDPTTIQALAAFDYGFINAIINNSPPAIQDIDAICRTLTIGIAYLQQSGIPEYHIGKEYHYGSFISSTDGTIFMSVINNNIGNALSDTASWMIYKSNIWRTETTAILNVAYNDVNLICNYATTTTVNLPAIGSHNKGRRIFIYQGSSGSSILTRAGSDTIDGASTFTISGNIETITIQSNGVNRWDIIGRQDV
jgi:hypothetical protein